MLADTEPVHWSCWADVLRSEGIELDWDTYVKHGIGVADVDMLGVLAERSPVPRDVATLLRHFEEKKALFRARTIETNPCLPQTVALVRSLSAFRLAVVTSSGCEEVAHCSSAPASSRTCMPRSSAEMLSGSNLPRSRTSWRPSVSVHCVHWRWKIPQRAWPVRAPPASK